MIMTDTEKYKKLTTFIKKQYECFKKKDLHIYGTEDALTIRSKDMYYGLFLAYENLMDEIDKNNKLL